MARAPRVRFTFRITEGPNAGLSSGGWRVWTSAEDTYVTATSLRGTWKVSLHSDEWWAASVTKEESQRENSVLPPGQDRAMWRFEPTPFEDGHRIAFAVCVFRHALLPAESDDERETVIDVADVWDQATLALVRMAEPGVEPDRAWNVVGGPLALSSGRRVWVTSHTERLGSHDPEPLAAGAMIEPVTPETHGVASPGWFVKGLHVDHGDTPG